MRWTSRPLPDRLSATDRLRSALSATDRLRSALSAVGVGDARFPRLGWAPHTVHCGAIVTHTLELEKDLDAIGGT